MTLSYILLILIVLILILLLYSTFGPKEKGNSDEIFYKEIGRIESTVKQEIITNRAELNQSSKDAREELAGSLKTFGDLFANNLIQLNSTVEAKLGKLTESFELKLKEFQESSNMNSKESRKELKEVLDAVKTDLGVSLKDFSERQRQSFGDLINNQNLQNTEQKDKLTTMSATIEKSIKSLQDDNAAKLEKMRETVDEKLQKTLETRLGESFKLVSERLEAVHKGLGDMQQLATGVGDIKKVLANVKIRGVLGEYQLENILEQLLTPEQYGKNIKTKKGSNALVEFAVKLPGHNENIMWLPLDSKFPTEDYQQLMDAYETGTAEAIDEARKGFGKSIKKAAADIRDKYIDPPQTTDFAILFLPFENLYAEVLRTPGLFDTLQRENKIIITGPTTLSAILNSLQMGFRTLAIEKRSSEVWDLLASVKTEFGKFGDILEKTKKKLQEASNVIGDAEIRSRSITRRLRDVHELPVEKAVIVIGDSEVIDLGADPDDNTEASLLK
jgi:DNA recombination protein RmuC